MRAGGGFGVVLHAEDRLFLVAHALDRLIVEVDAVHGDVGGERGGIDGEPVVLRGDFHAATGEVFDGLIAAAMAEFQFERFSAERLPENLVAEANAENRNARRDKIADGLHGVTERGGIAGAVGEEDAGGFVLERGGGGRGRGHDLHAEAALAEAAEDVVFHPEIVGDNRDVRGRQRVADQAGIGDLGDAALAS